MIVQIIDGAWRPGAARSLLAAAVLVTATIGGSRAADPSSPPVLPGEPWIVYQVVGTDTVPQRLHLVRPDGRDDHELVTDPIPDGEQGHPTWSPDGTRVAFDLMSPVDSSAEVWVVSVDGTGPKQLTTCSAPCLQMGYPAWSPDGREIAVNRYDLLPDGTWGRNAVEAVEVATGERRVVVETADGLTAYSTARWSPDGAALVFTVESYPDATEAEVLTSSIARAAADGSDDTPTLLTPSDVFAQEPDWAPGDRIAFVTATSLAGMDMVTTAAISTMDRDGEDVRRITTLADGGWGMEPTWAPDTDRILFTTGDAAAGQVWPALMEPDGTDLEELPWRYESPRPGIWRTHAHLRPLD